MSRNPDDSPKTSQEDLKAQANEAYIPPPAGEFLNHPNSLWMLFSTEFWERFCYYGMRAILVVFIAEAFYSHLNAEESKASASLIYGGFTALVYATGIFGGFIADRVLGYQRSILMGAILMALGMFLLLIPQFQFFLIGLSIVTAGNGLFKPNISSMVGKLYAPDDVRRDSGFTIFYMGINLGGFLAPIVCGTWIGANFGNKYGFLAAGIGMILGTLLFQFKRGMLGHIGHAPADRKGLGPILAVLAGVVAAIPIIYFLLSQSEALGFVLIGLMAVLALYLLWVGISTKDRIQTHRYIAMLILFFANTLFWAMFEQAGSSLNFFAKDYVSAPWNFTLFQSFNSFFIITLAPVFAALWPQLDKVRLNPSIPAKFSVALIMVGFGFWILNWSIHGTDASSKVGWFILATTYFVHTVAELCLSPIGLSMVTKLARPKEVGLAMGGWFLSIALANYLAGVIASIASGGSSTEHGEAAGSMMQYALVFNQLWWLGLISGGIFLIASPFINKLMHGVK